MTLVCAESNGCHFDRLHINTVPSTDQIITPCIETHLNHWKEETKGQSRLEGLLA